MSNPQSMQQLADKFMNDTTFREEMRRDPEGAAEGWGSEETRPGGVEAQEGAEPRSWWRRVFGG